MMGIKINIVFYLFVIASLHYHAEAAQEQCTASNAGQTTDENEGLGLSEDNPASLCRDIIIENRTATSGRYWINPLKGNPKFNPIEVWCKFPSGETCIYAEPVDRNAIAVSSTAAEVWMQTIGVEFPYKIHPRQLKVLQDESNSCIQSVTIHCKNVIAYYDEDENSLGNGVILFTWDGLQLTMKGPELLRMDSREDGCKVRSGEWAYTKLFYKTTKCRRLPIEDIAIRDTGRPDQWVKIDVGSACFSQGDGWSV